MTSNDVITQANVGGLAGPDLDLTALLRDKVLPEFLSDIRRPDWCRKSAVLTVDVGGQRADLPADCETVIGVYVDLDADPLEYVGEDERKVLASLTAEAGVVSGYFCEMGTPTNAQMGLVLTCPSTESLSLYCLYTRAVWLAEDGTSVDLDTRIPRRWHWALVEGMKREIYRERFGMGDERFVAAAQEFEAWKARAAATRESGPAGAMVKSIL